MILATVLSSAAAGAAVAADSRSKAINLSIRSEPAGVAPMSGQVLKWDARRGRWGLTLNVERPDARPSTMNDVQAGAYFRITPSLRVGGSVAFGDEPTRGTPNKLAPPEVQPRVRLETAFKF